MALSSPGWPRISGIGWSNFLAGTLRKRKLFANSCLSRAGHAQKKCRRSAALDFPPQSFDTSQCKCACRMSAVLTRCAVHMLNSDYYSSQTNPTHGNQKSPARREARDETIIKMKVIRKAVHQNDRRLFTPYSRA